MHTCQIRVKNKNATHKKRVVTQTFVVHKWSVTINDHLKKKKKISKIGLWGGGFEPHWEKRKGTIKYDL